MNPRRFVHVFVCAIGLAACVIASACGSTQQSDEGRPPVPASRETRAPEEATEAPAAPVQAPAAASIEDTRPRVVILGDSLTAGLGLSPDQAYPTLLQHKIDEAALDFHIVNAGVSGDTSAGGLSRLDWALEGNVQVLVVALGGNDALRGLPVAELEKNLATIIEQAQARKIRVALAGMEAPPNYGQDYQRQFHQVYPRLAKKYKVELVPFLLEGVGGIERLNQRDGIHPTAEGARLVADNVWTVLRPMLTR